MRLEGTPEELVQFLALLLQPAPRQKSFEDREKEREKLRKAFEDLQTGLGKAKPVEKEPEPPKWTGPYVVPMDLSPKLEGWGSGVYAMEERYVISAQRMNSFVFTVPFLPSPEYVCPRGRVANEHLVRVRRLDNGDLVATEDSVPLHRTVDVYPTEDWSVNPIVYDDRGTHC